MNKSMMKSIFDDLKEIVKPYEEGKPYYRPFVCNSDQTEFDIFLVGINPATPICEKDIGMDEYVKLLTSSDDFYQKYQIIRGGTEKPTTSRTRTGIVNFVDELKMRTGKMILETNVIPFPTSNIKQLKEVPSHVIEQAKGIFYRVLIENTPRVIIVHGKKSLEYLINMMAENKLIRFGESVLNQSISEIENNAPITFSYPDGRKGAIFACRHFMYYGKEGKTFTGFKKRVIQYIGETGDGSCASL